jgi:hypothetical protein
MTATARRPSQLHAIRTCTVPATTPTDKLAALQDGNRVMIPCNGLHPIWAGCSRSLVANLSGLPDDLATPDDTFAESIGRCYCKQSSVLRIENTSLSSLRPSGLAECSTMGMQREAMVQLLPSPGVQG